MYGIIFYTCIFHWPMKVSYNYLLTYDSYGPVHNRFHRGECITWASGGERALDTPGPLNGIERSPYEIYYAQGHKNHRSIGNFM